MGALFLSSPPNLHTSFVITSQQCKPNRRSIAVIGNQGTGRGKLNQLTHLKAVNDVVSAVVTTTTTDPSQALITWQVVLGSLAGVVPFVVAGIEFSKRIVAQRNCSVCKGSGLVLRDSKYYFRCPGCGGFLPWQSWKRFFSG